MSWYREDDGKIITDESFQDKCCECMSFCLGVTIGSPPCHGDKAECPYYKEVDTSEYDKEIRSKAIDEFVKRLYKIGEHREFDWEDIYRLADEMKGGAIDG